MSSFGIPAFAAPIRWGILVLLITGLTAAPGVSSAQALPVMRISLENTARHVQTISVTAFAADIAEQLAGRLDIRVFDSARMFRDKDVIAALSQGKVEMAVPGTWQIDRFVPDVGIFLLPVFYGKGGELNHKLMDGKVGKIIHQRIEAALPVTVPGRWIDLGHAHLYGVNTEIRRHSDIEGLRVRVAGGEANALRIAALGGIPRIIAWPDLRAKMAQKVIDGILTTHETVASARLWEAGIQSAFEDREYFPQYVPLINATFWRRLPPETRRIIQDTWERHVDGAREAAAAAQQHARNLLTANGVAIFTPSPAEIDRYRRRILPAQEKMVAAMSIDPELLALAEAEIAAVEGSGNP